jgi:hypothetical protein
MLTRTSKPWLFALPLALAFVAGGVAPLQASGSAEDALVRQIEKLTDAVEELGRRDVKTVFECRCGG